MWKSLSLSDKLDLVTKLHKVRDALMKERRSPLRKARSRKVVKKMHFNSPELEKIFNSMPIECQRLVMGG